jgi:Zn-dependent M28 family amino/carboxypeptidase
MTLRHIALWAHPLLAALLLAAPAGAQSSPPAPGHEAITADRLRADLHFLAGDGMRGRLTDTPENALALEWVKARFQWLGLSPAGPDGSYFAPTRLMRTELGEGNVLTVERGGRTIRHPVGDRFHPRMHSGSGRASGPLVFAGFGIHAPALGHDDLTGDLRGAVVLMLDNEPGANDSSSRFDGVVSSEHASQLWKTLDAQARGAAAVLFVTDVHNRTGPEPFDSLTRAYWPATPMRLPRYLLASWVEQVRIPVGQVSAALAQELVQGTGQSLLALARAAERPVVPRAIPGVTVTLEAQLERTAVPDRNVVARLEGSDPALRDEHVVLMAHVDHNGVDGADLSTGRLRPLVYNGADDNGSGTVGLLAIADAYARAAAAGQRPRRSILFLATNSEERGPLMGAWGYVEAPVVPLARTVAMLNMDMIGRNEEVPPGGGARFRGFTVQGPEGNRNAVHLVGYSQSPSLAAVVTRANAAFGLEVRQQYDNNVSQLLRRSDQWAFLSAGVPAINFFTGLHPDYHRVEDRPERIEYAKMERIVRLVHQVSWQLANDAVRPTLERR